MKITGVEPRLFEIAKSFGKITTSKQTENPDLRFGDYKNLTIEILRLGADLAEDVLGRPKEANDIRKEADDILSMPLKINPLNEGLFPEEATYFSRFSGISKSFEEIKYSEQTNHDPVFKNYKNFITGTLRLGAHLTANVLGLPKKANDILNSIPLKVDPLNLELLTEEATYFARSSDDFKTTQAKFDKALGINPNYIPSLIEKGNFLFNFGKVQDSIPCYAKATETDMTDPTPVYYMARAYEEIRYFDAATKFYLQSAQRTIKHPHNEKISLKTIFHDFDKMAKNPANLEMMKTTSEYEIMRNLMKEHDFSSMNEPFMPLPKEEQMMKEQEDMPQNDSIKPAGDMEHHCHDAPLN